MIVALFIAADTLRTKNLLRFSTKFATVVGRKIVKTKMELVKCLLHWAATLVSLVRCSIRSSSMVYICFTDVKT